MPRHKMKIYRTMRLVILVCQLGLFLRSEAQKPEACNLHRTDRPPENSDISVFCGTEYMEMSIYLCPVYNALYNESLMALNGQFDKAACHGVPDFTANPPVLKFSFSLSEKALAVCQNDFKIINELGSGVFADFSNVQYVNISGLITSLDPSAGTITYREQITYMFSCRYPMQYLVNNTEVAVTGVSLAVKDNNGTFISTLSMHLFKDRFYSDALDVPESGLNLKTRIFVGVKATNLTDRFNVMLDRCYATTSPFPSNSTFYDLFVGCTRDGQTKVELNGKSQQAHFSFEAFRFVEHRNLTISTFYLHCLTRLCEASICEDIQPKCEGESGFRRRREAEQSRNSSSDGSATVSSGPIAVTRKVPGGNVSPDHGDGKNELWSKHSIVGIIVAITLLALLCVSMAVFFVLYLRKKRSDCYRDHLTGSGPH